MRFTPNTQNLIGIEKLINNNRRWTVVTTASVMNNTRVAL